MAARRAGIGPGAPGAVGRDEGDAEPRRERAQAGIGRRFLGRALPAMEEHQRRDRSGSLHVVGQDKAVMPALDLAPLLGGAGFDGGGPAGPGHQGGDEGEPERPVADHRSAPGQPADRELHRSGR